MVDNFMKKLFKVLILLNSLSLMAFVPFSGNYVDGSLLKSESGVTRPAYSDQILVMEELQKKYPKIVSVIHYGDSIGARKLMGLLIKSPAPLLTSRLSVITGAIHGNEYLNIVDRLAKGLIEHKSKQLDSYLARGGSLFIIPVVNPDGYDRSQRGNMRGADLNRDWPGPGKKYRRTLKHPETKLLSVWLENYLEDNIKLDIAFDYHCCADGMLLLPWGWKRKRYMSEVDQLRSRKYEIMMEKYFDKPGVIGTPPDILYSARGTTLDYWYDKYKAVSFAYEGRFGFEPELLENHISWWNEILSTFKE